MGISKNGRLPYAVTLAVALGASVKAPRSIRMSSTQMLVGVH